MTLLIRTSVGGIELLKVDAIPDGISAIAGSIAIDITTNIKYRSLGLGMWMPISPGILPKPSPPLHASTHILSGSDQIDGDRLDIDFVPTNYTRNTSGVGIDTVTSVEHLSAHLKGIDLKIGGSGNLQVVYNDEGNFSGESAFTYNKNTNTLNVDNLSGSLTRLSDGSSYIRAGSGVAVMSSSSGAITIDAMTLPVINVTKDLTKLGYPANAVSGINGGGDPIQYAIDYYVANPDKFYAIHIPQGIYYISQPLIIASNQKFVSCEIIGTPTAYTQGGGGLSGNPGGPLIAWNSGSKPGGGRYGVDQPMLVIQGARRVSVQGIEFEGKNNAISPLVDGDLYYGILTASWDDWIEDDIRGNPFSPACCVAIDPFFNGVPGGTGSNMYPGLESYYNNGVYSATTLYQRGSSNITFKNCAFNFNAFGVVVSPAGPSGTIDLVNGIANRGEFIAPYWVPGQDRTQNAENFAFYDCFWNYNRVAYSTGQSQARQNNLHSPRMYGGCIAIDNENVAPGGNFGAPPMLSGAPNLGGFRYLFNLNTNVQNFHYANIYAEWFASIGRINFGHNGDQQGGKFTGCMFDFVVPSTAGSVSNGTRYKAPAMPFHVYHGGGHLEFDTCYFMSHDDPLRIHNPVRRHGVLKLNMCQIDNNDVKDSSTGVVKAPAGFAYINDVRIPEIRLRSQKSIYGHSVQEGIGIVGLPQYGTLSEAPPGWLTFTELPFGSLNASGSAGSFTVATSALPKLYYRPGLLTSSAAVTPTGTGWVQTQSSSLGVGDIANMFLAVYYPEMLTAVAHPLTRGTTFSTTSSASPLGTLCPYSKPVYNGPVGIITDIQSSGDNSTVTVSYLPEAFPFDTAVPIRFSRWDVTLGNFPPPADWPIP